MPGKKFLGLNDLPMLQAAEVGNDGQLGDRRLSLQLADLPNYLLRRADEADFLIHDFLVGQPGEGFQGAAGRR